MKKLKKIISARIYPIWLWLFLYKISNSLNNPSKYYIYCTTYFRKYLPKAIVEHRTYFLLDERSFGENAFVVMWYILYRKFKFKNFLEIGVYRGQVISLLTLIAKLENKEIGVTGVSPLVNADDSVSTYLNIDYECDIKQHFKYFDLPESTLIKEYSTSEVAVESIKANLWDCIYIDGSHDYEIVKQDFINTYPYLRKGGILIFDDSSFNLNEKEFHGIFKGHPDPSKVVDELVKSKMKEILRVGHNRCFLKI